MSCILRGFLDRWQFAVFETKLLLLNMANCLLLGLGQVVLSSGATLTRRKFRGSLPLWPQKSSDCCCVNHQPPSASHPTTSRSLLSPEITLLSRTLEVHGSRWRVRGQACETIQKCHPPPLPDILSISKVTKFRLLPNLNVCPN